jgi:hypothetical protein
MRMRTVAVLALIGLGGCTPEWARENNSDVLLIMEFVNGQAAGNSGSGTTQLQSDVRTPSIVNDNAELRLRSIAKNPSLTGNRENLTVANDVVLTRYTVRYYRADGRGIEGVDVPYAISGDMNTLIQADNTVTTSIIVVRHQAKIEPPLRNLFSGEEQSGLGGQRIVTMYAEIAVYGETISRRKVSAIGRLEIVFADYGNS